MSKSAIEWTGHTWNPIVGCSIKSPGCIHRYAMPEAMRQIRCAAGLKRETHYAGTVEMVKGKPVWTGEMAQAPEATLLEPLKRKKPTTYFVNSMGDLFHESVPDAWIDRVFAVMALSPQHTFQVLTKRAARMRDYLTKPHAPGKFITIDDDGKRTDTPSAHIRSHSAMCDIMPKAPARALNEACAWQDKHYPGGDGFLRRWPLPNVWLGVSAERQLEADERIPLLLQTPAAVRFISAEPLLGPIDLTNLGDATFSLNAFTGEARHLLGMRDKTLGGLDWVICGGESGPNARPMHPDWARSLRDQCQAAGVAFFFKQWGGWSPNGSRASSAIKIAEGHIGSICCNVQTRLAGHGWDIAPEILKRVPKKVAGRLLDGVEHNAMPERRP